jgi:hypothetical protein
MADQRPLTALSLVTGAPYPRELVAEMGGAYLCAEAGISPAVVENQAVYIQGWLSKLLRGDKRFVVIEAAQASAPQTTAEDSTPCVLGTEWRSDGAIVLWYYNTTALLYDIRR